MIADVPGIGARIPQRGRRSGQPGQYYVVGEEAATRFQKARTGMGSSASASSRSQTGQPYYGYNAKDNESDVNESESDNPGPLGRHAR